MEAVGASFDEEAQASTPGDSERTIQSVQRAFGLLETIAANDEPISLSELSRATGLHPSTTFHLIKTLIILGYVKQEDTKRYRVGPRIFSLAAGASREVELINLAMPYLRRLAEETNVTSNLAIRSGQGVSTIAKAEPRSLVRLVDHYGTRPLYCTAAGKIFLAALSSEELEKYLREERLEPLTTKTITKSSILRKQVKETATQGVAQDDTEWSDDAFCIAAPVRNYSSATIAAVGITGPSWQVKQRDVSTIMQQVKDVAAELSRVLGFR